jgi:hypothetical protein
MESAAAQLELLLRPSEVEGAGVALEPAPGIARPSHPRRAVETPAEVRS